MLYNSHIKLEGKTQKQRYLHQKKPLKYYNFRK